MVNKCRELHKENIDLYNYAQGGTLENLKFENGLEKSHIDILMLKLREKEEINKELENEVSECNEYVLSINKKIKVRKHIILRMLKKRMLSWRRNSIYLKLITNENINIIVPKKNYENYILILFN